MSAESGIAARAVAKFEEGLLNGKRFLSRGVDDDTVTLLKASIVEPKSIEWLWENWLAAGKLHVIAGSPGTGKTTLALSLAATISSGGIWPDRTPARVGDALIWSGEDTASDVLVPRLHAMGANCERISIIDMVKQSGTIRPFDPATDVLMLREHLAKLKSRPSLLIVDPIVSAVSGDSHKNSETRRSLQPLVDLGEELQCAILGVTHFSKGTAGRDPIERVTGSIAFGALARLVWATVRVPDDGGGGRFVARAKSNIGPDGDGFRYELRQVALPNFPHIQASSVLWAGAVYGSARQLLGQAEDAQEPDERSQADEAKDFLQELLANGEVKAVEAIKQARQVGISEKSLRTARDKLGVRSRKSSFADGWCWSLRSAPDAQGASEDAQDAQDAQDARTKRLGPLGAFEEISPTEGAFGESMK